MSPQGEEHDTVDWEPSAAVIEGANVTSLARSLGLRDYPALHRWSVSYRAEYWQRAVERLQIILREPYTAIVDQATPTQPRWLPGARMNIVDSCFQSSNDAPAVVWQTGEAKLQTTTQAELKRMVARVANGLPAIGIGPGDAVAIVMPMTVQAIAVYLGVIAAGAAAVSIADSFAPQEIAARLRISAAKLVFTQPSVMWGGKTLPLYDKIVAAGAPRAIVFDARACPLRAGDTTSDQFLSDDEVLRPLPRSPDDAINILFSSGTTGDPKAIPWDQTTPIKCGADAHFHHDVHPGDVLCWPTSLGWMMGPWLVFAALLNRATIALYCEAPTQRGFGEFVEEAGVTMLGVVPSLVRAWRQSECMAGLDRSRIRAFSSTGECSNPADMRYLIQLGAANAPVIEYCGGTEIGGGYVTGTVVQPCIASTFTTPALGVDIAILDEAQRPASKGEAYVIGPSMGLSTRLLNRDHFAIYFAGAPAGADGQPLRRHGDELELVGPNRYRVAGRCDDTMNLGGIKVGCAEIERVINQMVAVHETAAIAVSPSDGGPSQLVIFAVLKPGASLSPGELASAMQQAIREQLNPLFRVNHVRIVDALPRTASNKVMRRELRAQLAS